MPAEGRLIGHKEARERKARDPGVGRARHPGALPSAPEPESSERDGFAFLASQPPEKRSCHGARATSVVDSNYPSSRSWLTGGRIPRRSQ
jgi:hypothetical protein